MNYSIGSEGIAIRNSVPGSLTVTARAYETECAAKDRRIAELEAEVAELRGALRDLLGAVDLGKKAGCIDHIDCMDEAPAWYMALIRARAAIKSA